MVQFVNFFTLLTASYYKVQDLNYKLHNNEAMSIVLPSFQHAPKEGINQQFLGLLADSCVLSGVMAHVLLHNGMHSSEIPVGG